MENNLVWIIYDKFGVVRNEAYIRLISEEFKRRGYNPLLLIAENLRLFHEGPLPCFSYAGDRIDAPFFVVNRTPDFLLSRHLERMGLTVFNNSRVTEMCNDKMKTHRFLSGLGAPVLRTEPIGAGFTPGFFPAVVKPTDGHGGDGVFYVQNEAEYKAALSALDGRSCLFQEPSDVLGRDVRVYAVGREIVAAVLREAGNGFKSNYCLGGRAGVYTLSPAETALVNKVISAADFDFVGIDFLFHKGGIAFNEIEDPVGARALYALTDINIADKFIDYTIIKMKGTSQ